MSTVLDPVAEGLDGPAQSPLTRRHHVVPLALELDRQGDTSVRLATEVLDDELAFSEDQGIRREHARALPTTRQGQRAHHRTR